MGRSVYEAPRLRCGRALGWALGALLVAFAAVATAPPAASALILPPTTIDGPSTEGLALGDVAMAPDGTGGVVYTKSVGGVPHAFVSRYSGGWSAPIRVDDGMHFEATEPRIAAGRNGRLLVVWVTPVATVDGEVRKGLYSATLGPGAGDFGPPLLVDPNVGTGVGTGVGVDPSLDGVSPGKAAVAYRVITFVFGLQGQPETAVQLRPGDVMAEIRVARLRGDRWSRTEPVNRYPAASMRPPGESNGPEIAIGATGRAVVAWQEPDLTGVARVWMRRVTGTTLGPVLAASPETWNGQAVADDATAVALDVSDFDRARVAVRVDGAPGSPLNGPRVFLTTLGSSDTAAGAQPVGPQPVDGGGGVAPVGPPAVAVSDGGGGEGSMRLGFAAGAGIRLVEVDADGRAMPPWAPAAPTAAPAAPAVVSVDPEGGGTVAYQALDGLGLPAVAVYQEHPQGGSQTGLLYGPTGGDISQLIGGTSGVGDALLAFRQGESGRFAIVAARLAAAPGKFGPRVPERWVRAGRAWVRWPPPPSAVGGTRYALLLDGKVVKAGLERRRIRPPRNLIGTGARRVQVKATDRLGQEVLSRSVRLRVDQRRPRLRVAVPGSGVVRLRLRDAHAGLVRRSTRVRFGDGERARGGRSVPCKPGGKRGRGKRRCPARARRAAVFSHRYARPGRYTIRVRARDRANNRLWRRIPVVVR